jgi:hypothetical protein
MSAKYLTNSLYLIIIFEFAPTENFFYLPTCDRTKSPEGRRRRKRRRGMKRRNRMKKTRRKWWMIG